MSLIFSNISLAKNSFNNCGRVFTLLANPRGQGQFFIVFSALHVAMLVHEVLFAILFWRGFFWRPLYRKKHFCVASKSQYLSLPSNSSTFLYFCCFGCSISNWLFTSSASSVSSKSSLSAITSSLQASASGTKLASAESSMIGSEAVSVFSPDFSFESVPFQHQHHCYLCLWICVQGNYIHHSQDCQRMPKVIVLDCSFRYTFLLLL